MARNHLTPEEISANNVRMWQHRPRATGRSWHTHTAIVTQILGHPVPKGAVIHHVDGNPAHNVPNNLVVLQNQGEHKRLHKRASTLRAGGNPWTQQVCSHCRQVKDFAAFFKSHATSNGRQGICRDCTTVLHHRRWCEKHGRENRYLTPTELHQVLSQSGARGNAARREHRAAL